MKTIFIVDDKDTNLLLAKTALEGAFKTFALPSAERMFKLADKITPDLILLDIDMPDMDGFEAMSILKKDEKLKSIPVIFLTGKNDAASEIHGFELGALDFINKPFSAPVLLKRVESHIEMDNMIKAIHHKNEELMKIDESKNNILAMISHDMRNYLGSIQQAIDLINLKHQGFDDNKYIKIIDSSAGKALNLLKDILSINKLEAELDDITFTRYDLNKLITESNENLKLIAKQKSINMIFDFPEEPIFCMLHPEKFHRALDNLCINAIKFTNANGTITVKARVVGELVEIHIVDTGIGIEPEMIDKLFEKYTKAGRTGTAGEASTGLGLYIVKQIIGLHSGTIEVKSVVGEGSEFIIKLPLASSTE
ncbi:MAG: hybrid sensor histidine kinase/response regulator [Candidatus Cloacimonetes bacterium]|nr:hybrid sensor histidine kinase/response regulator [Candidatus Cloacimonadota bacterium]